MYEQISREILRARNIAWHRENPEYRTGWRLGNRERIRAKNAAYYLGHKEKWAGKRYDAERHREAGRVAANKRRALLAGAVGEKVEIAKLVSRDGERCGECGLVVLKGEMSIDHILPISRGGGNTYANTRMVHLVCNKRRGNRGVAQLRLMG